MLESGNDSRHYPQVRGARFAEGGGRLTGMPRMTLRLRYRTLKLPRCAGSCGGCARGNAVLIERKIQSKGHFMKAAVTTIESASAIFFVISGVSWIMAARIIVRPMGGVIGPPPRAAVENANNQAWWNSLAAGFAAAASIAQAVAIPLKMISD
jgi:hypothetical protein